MKDKIALLMNETGCDRGEAELALELCGYEVEQAVQAVPRLFQNIAVFKGKLREETEGLYGLCLVILNLKGRSLVRARAVVSYNPAVYAGALDRSWFEFEKHLYACRLWEGTLQKESQEVERKLGAYFGSPEAEAFYSERPDASDDRGAEALGSVLTRAFPGRLWRLTLRRDLLDMGQFQELGPAGGAGQGGPRRRRRGPGRSRPAASDAGVGGTLVLRIMLVPSAEGVAAGELRAGDLVYARINDSRDIAQYLATLFGTRGSGSGSMLVPVEAVETGPRGEVGVRVRFSLGVCGDVNLPPDIRLSVVRRRDYGVRLG